MDSTVDFNKRFNQRIEEINSIRGVINASLSDAEKLDSLVSRLINYKKELVAAKARKGMKEKIEAYSSLLPSSSSLLNEISYFKKGYSLDKIIALNKNQRVEEIKFFFSSSFEQLIKECKKELDVLKETDNFEKYIQDLDERDGHKNRFISSERYINDHWDDIIVSYLKKDTITKKDYILRCASQYRTLKPYEDKAAPLISRAQNVSELTKLKNQVVALKLPDIKPAVDELIRRLSTAIASAVSYQKRKAEAEKKAATTNVVTGIITIAIPSIILLYCIVASIIGLIRGNLENEVMSTGGAVAGGIFGGLFLGIYRFIISLSGFPIVWKDAFAGTPIPSFVMGIVGLGYFIFTWIIAFKRSGSYYFASDWHEIGLIITKIMFYIGFGSLIFSMLSFFIYYNGNALAVRYDNAFGGYVLGFFYTIWDFIKLIILEGFWGFTAYSAMPILHSSVLNIYFFAAVAFFIVTLVFLLNDTIEPDVVS